MHGKKKKKNPLWGWCNDLKMGPVSMKKIYGVPGEYLRMGQLRFLLLLLCIPLMQGSSRG